MAHYSTKYDRLFGKPWKLDDIFCVVFAIICLLLLQRCKTGNEQVKEATKVTQINRKYGFVSSENKKDQRSIEQTLDDIRAKKRQKKDVTN